MKKSLLQFPRGWGLPWEQTAALVRRQRAEAKTQEPLLWFPWEATGDKGKQAQDWPV
jgi:hypothetical protein